MAAARYIVSGKVQGVFFRASTREKALALGLDGHARNLRDGSVEVLAAGSSDALDALGAWLWTGSPASRVENVIREPSDASPAAGFRTD